jgi:hypothetical protein
VGVVVPYEGTVAVSDVGAQVEIVACRFKSAVIGDAWVEN